MDCRCLRVKQLCLLVDSLSSESEIMGYTSSDPNHAVNYKEWKIALSRRFRAIKLWIVICRYGLTSLMDHILSDVEMVKRFEALVIKDKEV